MKNRAIVTRVIDGDTFEAKVDLGFCITTVITVRLWGINCAEMHHGGEAAKEYVKALIEGKDIGLWSYHKDSFGRWICDCIIGSEFLSDILLRDKLAVAYFPEEKEAKCREKMR